MAKRSRPRKTVRQRHPVARPRLRPRALRWWRSWEWPIVAGLFVFGLVFGTIGYAHYYASQPDWQRSFIDHIYHSFQLTVLHFNALPVPAHWTLHLARFLLPALAAYTAVKAVIALYSEQLQNLRVRLFFRNHVVVCGLGQRGLVLVSSILARGEQVVVIEQDGNNEQVPTARDMGAIVIFGDATCEQVLRRAGVARARSLVALASSDGLTAEIVIKALAVTGTRDPGLNCHCHVDGSRLRELLESHRIGAQDDIAERVDFFSVYEDGAEALMRLEPPFTGVTPDSPPYCLVLGVGRMGEKLLLQLARDWQVQRGDSRSRLRIGMLDRLAESKMDYLLTEHPELDDICRLEPVFTEIKSPEFHAGQFLSETDWQSLSRIYVCLDDDAIGLTAALRFEALLRKRGRMVPIVLRTREDHGLTVLFPRAGSPDCPENGVKAFPLLEYTCTAEAILKREVKYEQGC